MKSVGSGKLVGFRSGTKNGKDWGNVFIDDNENLLERVQIFVNANMVHEVKAIPVGSDVNVKFHVYSVNNGNGYGLRLVEITKK